MKPAESTPAIAKEPEMVRLKEAYEEELRLHKIALEMSFYEAAKEHEHAGKVLCRLLAQSQEQGGLSIEGGISEDDADMLFNDMSWEVKFDPRAVTDKRADFLHATLVIKPRAILGTESENGADDGD